MQGLVLLKSDISDLFLSCLEVNCSYQKEKETKNKMLLSLQFRSMKNNLFMI